MSAAQGFRAPGEPPPAKPPVMPLPLLANTPRRLKPGTKKSRRPHGGAS